MQEVAQPPSRFKSARSPLLSERQILRTAAISEATHLGYPARVAGESCTVEVHPYIQLEPPPNPSPGPPPEPVPPDCSGWLNACYGDRDYDYLMFCCEYYWQNYYQEHGGYCCYNCFLRRFLCSMRQNGLANQADYRTVDHYSTCCYRQYCRDYHCRNCGHECGC